MRVLTDQEVMDSSLGCTMLATGGGGSMQESLGILKEDFETGKKVSLISLEEFMGTKFSGVCSTELGAANLAEAIHIAMQLDLPLVDGDPVGRCVPELQHSTYYLKGVKINPMAVVTEFGDVVILDDVVDDFRAESIVRAISAASNDMVGVVDHPITGKVAQEFGGKLLFRGVITDMPWESVGGFNVGDIHLEGIKEYEGHVYRIWFKNENMIGYYDGVKNITIPDMICMLDKDGTPITTPNYKVGTEMTLVAMPAPEVWKTEKGLACFGPAYFGSEEPYVPFEVE